MKSVARNLIGLAACAALPACATRVEPIEAGNPRRDRGFDLVATTFHYSNAPPEKRSINAAARQCGLSSETSRETMAMSGPYGIHGLWMMDFACPAHEREHR